jgi:hypothetical protein
MYKILNNYFYRHSHEGAKLMPMKQQPVEIGDQAAIVISKAAVRAADIFGLSHTILSRILGLSESQVSRVSRGQAVLDGKARELGLLFVRLFRGLEGIVGNDDDSARSWLVTPNAVLGGKPVEMIQTVHGLMEAVLYVDSRRARI